MLLDARGGLVERYSECGFSAVELADGAAIDESIAGELEGDLDRRRRRIDSSTRQRGERSAGTGGSERGSQILSGRADRDQPMLEMCTAGVRGKAEVGHGNRCVRQTMFVTGGDCIERG